MWVEMWLYRLSPRVKFGEEHISVPARYALLDKVLSAAPKSYRRDIFGYDVVTDAPDEWYEMVAFHNLKNITRDEWEKMPLDERGKHLAYLRLSGMISIIERHTELQDREKKRLEEEAKGKSKSGKRTQGEYSPEHEAD